MAFSIYSNLDDLKLNFSGHETFPFRYTWLPKGVQYVKLFPNLFYRNDDIVILGVGKNMVKSIRYWCERLDLIESTQRGIFCPTKFGQALFSSDGWDPFLEHPATLWLLHWKLASRIEKGTTWFLAFTRWGAPTFTKDQLINWIKGLIENNTSTKATYNTLKRDIDVFVRTYIQSRKKNKFIEDSFDCPLVELGLIQEVDFDVYEFTSGARDSLPDEILSFTICDYWMKNSPNQKSISFETLHYGPGSPGRVLGLSENAMYDRLSRLPDWSGIELDTTAGKRNIYRKTRTPTNPMDFLSRYYRIGT